MDHSVYGCGSQDVRAEPFIVVYSRILGISLNQPLELSVRDVIRTAHCPSVEKTIEDKGLK